MKSKLLIVLAVVGFIGSVAVQAQLTGDIYMSANVGSVTLNAGLATATAYSTIAGVTVFTSGNTGSFVGFNTLGPAYSAAFNTFSFGGSILNPNPLTLWTATDGSGNIFELIANSVTISGQNSEFLDLSGTGTIYEEVGGSGGFVDGTPGVWTIDDTSASGLATVTFGSNTEAVPDGGTTVLLLGAALTGLAVIKRYMS